MPIANNVFVIKLRQIS